MDQDQQPHWRRPPSETAPASPPVTLPPSPAIPQSSAPQLPQTPPQTPSPTPPPVAPAPPPPPPVAPASIYSGYDLTTPSPTQGPALAAAPGVDSDEDEVSWQASEYVHWQKGAGWYGLLALASVVILGVALWLQLWTFAALVVVMVIAIVVYARRAPRQLRYTLSHRGLEVEGKFYDFNQFRAFGIVPEGALYSILLLPTRRFMPTVMIYFAHEDGEKIVDVLGSNLPMEQLRHDFLDTAIRKLRF